MMPAVEGGLMNDRATLRDHHGHVAKGLRDVEAMFESANIQHDVVLKCVRTWLVQVKNDLAATFLNNVVHVQLVAEQSEKRMGIWYVPFLESVTMADFLRVLAVL